MNFSGKTLIVTGASRGIGKAVAAKFAALGANVIINAQNFPSLQQTLSDLRSVGGEVSAVCGDISDFSFAQHLVDEANKIYGNLNFVVNNAGIAKDNLIMRMSLQHFEEVIDVNLKGSFNLIKAACKLLIKSRGGAITNVSSIVGIMGNAGQANYAASKAGVIGLTKSVAKELACRAVRCNAVAPGFIETSMTERLTEDTKKMYLESVPLKRFGTADEVANLIAFLSSDEASYITGQVIKIDGGLLM